MSTALIHCKNLRKNYGFHSVLHDVDFSIEPGRLTGFLGPNGAGKTTTIRILLGLLNPTSGQSSIFGKSSQTDGKSIRCDIGYLPGDVNLYPRLTGRRTLEFMARARRKNCDDEIDRLAQSLGLELDKRVRNYSTGMRQKLGLIQALMHKPQLLILDEPTSALDPLIRKTVFAELKSVVQDGRSVLFSSHSLSEVEELCDEVIVLREGRIVEQQLISTLQSKALRNVEIVFASEEAIPSKLPDLLTGRTRDGATIKGVWTGNTKELVQWLGQREVIDLIVAKPDLSDLFLAYYESDDSSKSTGDPS